MECYVVLSLQRPVAGCGEGGHHEGKQGARRMSELIALQGRCLCTFGSSVPCRLRMANAGYVPTIWVGANRSNSSKACSTSRAVSSQRIHLSRGRGLTPCP